MQGRGSQARPGQAVAGGGALDPCCAAACFHARRCRRHMYPHTHPLCLWPQGAKSPLLWDEGQAEELLAGSPVVRAGWLCRGVCTTARRLPPAVRAHHGCPS